MLGGSSYSDKHYSDISKVYTDVEVRRRLQSASTSTLIVLSTRRSTLGDHAFLVAAARAWNALPSSAKFIASASTLRLTV